MFSHFCSHVRGIWKLLYGKKVTKSQFKHLETKNDEYEYEELDLKLAKHNHKLPEDSLCGHCDFYLTIKIR